MRLSLLFAAMLVVAACKPAAPEPVAVDVPTEAPSPVPAVEPRPVPAPVPRLTRGDLVSAAAQAASAFAEGQPPPQVDPLVGRTFTVRIPFGCGGPRPAVAVGQTPGLADWSWGGDGKTIQLRLEPADWSASAMFAAPEAAERWEAVEGFWVPRPWLATETCPAVQPDPLQTGAAAVSPQSVGLAAVFEKGGSRIGRRDGRAYSFTVRSPGEEPLVAPAGGYRLLLEGRIASFPNGRAFACRAAGPDQRPVCIAAVQLDRVAFEAAEGGVLTEWRTG